MIVAAPPDDTCDVAIVGAGAVGLALATTLARRGVDVVVIEAGGEHVHPGYESANAGVQGGAKEHLGLIRGRYQGLGGTTRLWGGQLMPFTRADFEPDPAHNKPGWLYGWDEIAPWIDAALAFAGRPGGYAGIEREWLAKTDRALTLGDDLQIAPSVWMKEPDFAVYLRDEIRSARGPRVLLDHSCVGFSIDAGRGAVDGVRVRDGRHNHSLVRARSCVAACGTLENSRLLLRARASLTGTPLSGNRHVGQWFVDHLHCNAGEIAPLDRDEFGTLFDTFYAQGHKITPKLRISEGLMRAEGLSNCAATINAPFGPGEAIAELRGLARRIMGRGGEGSLGESLRRTADRMRLMLPLVWRYLRTRRSGKFLSGNVLLGIEVEQIPTRDSYIYLEPGVPPEQARVGIHWSLDGAEIRAMAHCAVAVKALCESRGLGRVDLDPRVLAEDRAFFDDCTDSSHQIGGCRMAASAEHGVTDADGQVHGMPGLFVAGAATFPSGSFANPTLTALATTLRLGAHLERLVR